MKNDIVEFKTRENITEIVSQLVINVYELSLSFYRVLSPFASPSGVFRAKNNQNFNITISATITKLSSKRSF